MKRDRMERDMVKRDAVKREGVRSATAAALLFALAGATPFAVAQYGAPAAQAPAHAPAPVVRENAILRISENVYLIPDARAAMVPNVGIIVGEKATLVVDPGMGMKSGTIVLREAMRVRKGADLYVVNTHFHPEHTTGELAFPDGAMILRAAPQQQDIEEMGMKWVQSFASRSPVIADVLQGFTGFRTPTEIFGREKTLDLGGVRVRILHLGPGHTRGDTVVFVEEDRVLFSGAIERPRVAGEPRCDGEAEAAQGRRRPLPDRESFPACRLPRVPADPARAGARTEEAGPVFG
jgi:glyoxylase-like metal-dependent hydrolase (beta-lactamase superfamily II)